MITKINDLKISCNDSTVKSLCESALTSLTSMMYNNVSKDAKDEIERVTIDNLFKKLEKINTKVVNEWLSNQKRNYFVKNLGVKSTIKSLLEGECKYNSTLNTIIVDYKSQTENIPEVLLYESFDSVLTPLKYIPAVEKKLTEINENVKKYKNDVEISKILESMKVTRSNYLIPLIEDAVANYLNNKTEQTKHMLKETLIKFSYDPYVLSLINCLQEDATSLQLEYANTASDIKKVFSPIIYLGENETVFNVGGMYYIKKGNTINKIKTSDTIKLDPKFRNLCESINLSNVVFGLNEIKVYKGSDTVVINESGITINGQFMTKKQLNESKSISNWTGKGDLYTLVETLNTNFDNIAELDFAKIISLKENENYGAHVFKLRDNISITTFDNVNNKATFYRNINPIQANKLMMEHLRFDVSKSFTDILPNQDRILAEINETKVEYNEYMSLLETKIEEFKNAGFDAEMSSTILETLNDELDEVRNSYKDYLNEIEAFTTVNENLTITVQDDVSGDSHTVVVPTNQGAGTAARGAETIPGTDVVDQFGVTPGQENMDQNAASAITFDSKESEILSDEPSDKNDSVDLGADEAEADADEAEAKTTLEDDDVENKEGEEGASTGGLDFDAEDGSDQNVEETPETDLNFDEENPDDKVENKNKKKKKTEESLETPEVKNTEEPLKQTSFDNTKTQKWAEEDKLNKKPLAKPKKKVFLVKKKTK